jgi:transposase-like protein
VGLREESPLKGKRHSPEQIVGLLREVDRLQAEEGLNVAAAAKRIGVAEFTVYRWRKQMGGMSKPDAKRLKDLEKENARLKRLLAEKELDNSILKEALEGKY